MEIKIKLSVGSLVLINGWLKLVKDIKETESDIKYSFVDLEGFEEEVETSKETNLVELFNGEIKVIEKIDLILGNVSSVKKGKDFYVVKTLHSLSGYDHNCRELNLLEFMNDIDNYFKDYIYTPMVSKKEISLTQNECRKLNKGRIENMLLCLEGLTSYLKGDETRWLI